MEFPNLGSHCGEPTCARLDFLPFTCDACYKVFCLDHKTYEGHRCSESYAKDVKVPVCPLCNQPVPIARGDDPNIKMDQHIRNDCHVEEEKKKLYTNSCSFKGCKKRELVQVNCNTCHRTFCLKHRFETDHDCGGAPGRLGNSKMTSTSQKKPQSTTLSGIGAELNQERLARHRQQQSYSGQQQIKQNTSAHLIADQSLEPHPPPPHQQEVQLQCEEDEALARAIAESLQPQQKKLRTQQQSANNNTLCNVS